MPNTFKTDTNTNVELEKLMEPQCTDNLIPNVDYTKLKTRTSLETRKDINKTPNIWQNLKACFVRTSLFEFLPILKWLPKYNVKESLIGDLVAGLTVSVLQIPHGLAFAQLAHQEPVVGLYMAVFPVLIYTVLGTSTHLSLGMQAILIIMVGKIVEQHAAVESDVVVDGAATYTPLEVGMVCTLAIGLWQAVLACCQLGTLCVFLSTSLVSGLTTAAAIHIIFFQLKHVFGVHIALANGPLKLIYATISLFENLPGTNYVVLAVSFSFMAVLVVFNFYVKPLLANKCKYPIPMEFIMICASVILSWALDLNSYNVRVVGIVPSGLPEPTVPPLGLIPTVAFDCLVIALVNLSINISVAKVFATKANYEISENQEVLAYGCSNIFGAFFHSLPVCTALSRSMLLFSLGAKTPLVHLICLLSVLAMLFLSAIFELVPLCVLAGITIVNMIPLLAQMLHFPTIWRCSKNDGLIWIITFVVVILVDLDYGIAAGLITSIVIVLYTSTRTDIITLQKVGDIFIDENVYLTESEPSSKILVLDVTGNLNFVNSGKLFRKIKSNCRNFISRGYAEHIVLNFTKVNFIDPTAISDLNYICQFISEHNCKVIITGCNDEVYKQLDRCQFFENFDANLVALDLNQAYNFLMQSTV